MKTAIVTNTHGDELVGLYVVEKLKRLPYKFDHIIGNPCALMARKRFIDTDLNRSFLDIDNADFQEKPSYEIERARYLDARLDEYDVVFDIHSTKSLVKDTAIFTHDTPLTRYIINLLGARYGVYMTATSGSLIGSLKDNQIGIAIEYGDDTITTGDAIFNSLIRFFEQVVEVIDLYNIIEQNPQQFFEAYAEVKKEGEPIKVENMVLLKKGTPIAENQVADEDFYPFLFGGDYNNILGFKMKKL